MNTKVVDAPIVKTLGVSELPEPFVDETDLANGVVIYGWAPIGTAEDEEGWRLMKKVTDNDVTKYLYPQASMNFKFKWSDRSGYSYAR